MKTTFTLLITLLSFNIMAQDWVLIGTDPEGDCTSSCMDIRELRYDYDIALDSAWFRIITYEPNSNSDGYYIHINWEDSDTDGDDWTGGTFDLDFNQNRQINIMYATAYYWIEEFDAGVGSFVSDEVNVSFPNTLTTIINCKLSDIDPNLDGVFELAGSVGNSSYGIFDLLPDSGAAESSGNASLSESQAVEFDIYPNPATNAVHIQFGKKEVQKVRILNTIGQEVYNKNTKNLDQLSIDVSAMPEGVYFVEVNDLQGTETKRLVIH